MTPALAAAASPDRVPSGAAPRETLWLFSKHGDERLTANFSLRELHCRCTQAECFVTLVHPRLADLLQTLRDLLARPVVVTSGFRCRAHNDRIGGRARSFHLQGMAADIACPAAEQEELLESARRIPALGGLGIYPGKGIVHLDVRRRPAGAPIVEWSE